MGSNNSASAENSTSVGYFNTASGFNSSVFGSNSFATAFGSTAIGNDSIADEANTISVGKVGAEKRITNVADALNGTDAVNKRYIDTALAGIGTGADAKIYTDTKVAETLVESKGYTDEQVLNLNQTINTKYIAINVNDGASAQSTLTSGIYSSALGINNYALGSNSTAIGHDNQVIADDGIAVGINNKASANYSSVFGSNSVATAFGATAIGHNSFANEENTISVGRVGEEKRITNVADALNDTDAVNRRYVESYIDSVLADFGSKSYTENTAPRTLSLTASENHNDEHVLIVKQTITAAQHKELKVNETSAEAIASGDNAISLAVNAQVSGNSSGVMGDSSNVIADNSYSIGNNNNISGDNTFVLGNNVETSANNTVILGNESSSNRDNTISVGSTTNQRQIINVAAGAADTDAVNLSQLQTAKTSAIETSKTYTDTRFASLNDSFQSYVQESGQRFKEIDERFDRQGAMSAAMLNMATSTSGLQGKNRIGVGAGFQGSEQAVSLGYQRVINPNASVSLGGAFTKDESSGGMGMGFSW